MNFAWEEDLLLMTYGGFKMEQLKLPFKNDDIDKWNYLMENSYKFPFSVEQHEFVIRMKRKHGWSFGDKVELNGSITPWGFEEVECDPSEPPRYTTARVSCVPEGEHTCVIDDELYARIVDTCFRLNESDDEYVTDNRTNEVEDNF